MFPIIYKMVNELSDEKDRRFLKAMLDNEMHHYIELKHGKKLLDLIWKLEYAIKNQYFIKILYEKQNRMETVERIVKPVGIMFSEFYFYMTAFIENIDKEKEFENPNDDYPTI